MKGVFIINGSSYTTEEIQGMSHPELIELKGEIDIAISAVKLKESSYKLNNTEEKNSDEFWKRINRFRFVKNKLNEAINLVNNILGKQRDEQKVQNIIKSNNHIREENKYLYYFWKVAKLELSSRAFRKLSEKTQVFQQLPESLKGHEED